MEEMNSLPASNGDHVFFRCGDLWWVVGPDYFVGTTSDPETVEEAKKRYKEHLDKRAAGLYQLR